MVTHVCNPSPQDSQTGGLPWWVLGQSRQREHGNKQTNKNQKQKNKSQTPIPSIPQCLTQRPSPPGGLPASSSWAPFPLLPVAPASLAFLQCLQHIRPELAMHLALSPMAYAPRKSISVLVPPRQHQPLQLSLHLQTPKDKWLVSVLEFTCIERSWWNLEFLFEENYYSFSA